MNYNLEVFTLKNFLPLWFLVEKTRGISQLEEYHPEQDVYVHSIQTFLKASRETNDIDLLIAALIHDVGKAVGSRGHADDYAEPLIKDLVSPKTLWLVVNHMRINYYLDGSMNKLSKVKELVGHPWFIELIQLSRFDKMGRVKGWTPDLDIEKAVKILNKAVDTRWKKQNPSEPREEAEDSYIGE